MVDDFTTIVLESTMVFTTRVDEIPRIRLIKELSYSLGQFNYTTGTYTVFLKAQRIIGIKSSQFPELVI